MKFKIISVIAWLLFVSSSIVSAATIDISLTSAGDGYFNNQSCAGCDSWNDTGASISAHYQFWGFSSDVSTNNGYAQFSLASAPAAANIVSATLLLNLESAYLTPPTPSAGTINHASNSSGATGNASQKIGGDQLVGTIYDTMAAGWYSFDVTSYLSNDITNGYSWSAFSFDPNTSGTYNDRFAGFSFSSADSGNGAYLRFVTGPALLVSPSGPTYNNDSVTIAADSGAINGTWNGSAAGGTLSGAYVDGTAILLTATLPPGTVVSSWGTGCDSTTATTCSISSLTTNTTISPVFAPDTRALTVSPSGPTYSNGSVTIAADSGAINGTWNGSATGGTLAGDYIKGAAIVLTATLPAGTVVSSWGAGCDATTATTCTLNAGTLTSNTTISPVFALDTRTLTVSPSGPTYSNGSVTIAADSGAISGTWDGSAAGGTFSDTYNYGTAVVLTATLPAGTVVSSWGAGCDSTTATTCTLNAGTLTSDTTISPVFEVDAKSLTVSPSGPTYSNGSVTIAADSGAISGTWDGSAAGGTLSDTYNYGTAVVLTATLPTGTVVSSWGAGCDSTTATTCTLNAGTLTSNTTIAPVFALDTRTLTVNPSGPTYSNGSVTIAADSGAISGTWDGSAAGGTLSDTYNYGTAVVLTATLPAGTVVSNWGAGCDSTTATTCTLNAGTLTSDTTISPVFALDTRTLTVSPSGPTYSNVSVTIAADSGAISGTWDGSASGGTLSDTYNYGTAVVLTATLPTSTVVSSWGAGCNSTTATTCTITNLTTNMTISPAFAVNNDPTFTGTPTITGIAKVGKTLSLVDTLTSDIDGDIVTLSYQWAADGVDILDATSDTYNLTLNEVQKNVTCTLTADDGNGGEVKFTTVGVDVGNSFPWPMFLPTITSNATP